MEDKVFKIEKVIHRVDKYDVYAICEFMHAGELFAANKKVRHTCFKCNHKFQDDDFTYLGLIKKHKNEIFCEKCANEIAEVIGMAKLKDEGENEQKVVDKAVDWIRDNFDM